MNRKLQTLALTQLSTDCQLMNEVLPGRRGGSVALQQKRLRIRGKLVTSAEEGDMRHILSVFEAIQIHKQARRFLRGPGLEAASSSNPTLPAAALLLAPDVPHFVQ